MDPQCFEGVSDDMLITENDVRKKYDETDGLKEYFVPRDVLITPAAREFLLDRRVKVVYEKKGSSDTGEPSRGFYDLNGRKYFQKPEHLTHLKGNILVPKDHPRIVLRGRLDSLQSKIIETQILVEKLGKEKLSEQLQKILLFVRNLVRAEVMDEKVKEQKIAGMSFDDIHSRSHDPMKYYGFPHLMIEREMGEIAVALNTLRSETREVEIAAYKAFSLNNGNISRLDIITSLNRLNSCFYIMIFENMPAEYKPRPSGI